MKLPYIIIGDINYPSCEYVILNKINTHYKLDFVNVLNE